MNNLTENFSGKTALLFLLMMVAGCNDRSLRSSLVGSPPKIDGDLTEWRDVPVALSEEKTVALGAVHDAHFLYVAVRCADQEKIRQVERRGITMWIDPENGDRKDLEIQYPASRYAEPDPKRGGFWEAMTDSERETASKKLERMRTGVLVIDKRSLDSRIFSSDSAEGFAAATAVSNGVLSFEVRIPLHIDVYFGKFASLTDREKVRIGVSLNGDKFLRSGGGENLGPMGFPGGGRFGGGSRGMVPRRRTTDTDSELWVEIVFPKAS